MNEDFHKFPSTPHLATLPGLIIRGDKVFSARERDEFLGHSLTIEEKVDGANLGISFDFAGNVCAQNRGSYLSLPSSGQWKKLNQWLEIHTDTLFDHLSNQYILFGEWCYAQHSLFYDHLPDWFLAFDIYERRSQRFLSTAKRDYLINQMSLAKVPWLGYGHFTFHEIKGFLSQSKLANRPAEGIYLRYDQDDWLEQRAKLVCPAFIQSITEHWSCSAIQPNRLLAEGRK